MPDRSPEQIRASIEANRQELGRAVQRLRTDVAVATDWRRQVAEHRREVLIGAALAGFVLGGGIAALSVLGRRRRGR